MSAPAPPAPEAPDTPPRRRGPGPTFWVVTTVAALAVGVLVATAVVDTGGSDDVVSVEDFVQGDAVTSVNGRAEEGRPAPDTAFEYLDGGEGTIEDFRGTPLVMNFWASSCAPCLAEMPAFESVHRELGDQVAILGFDVAEAAGPGRAMVERTGVTYPQGRDPRGDLVRAFGGIGLPHTVVVDADGTIVSMHNRAMDAEEIRRALEPVLGN
jgi:cytochrome c biogenesis protein CcmG/thiol:disulfide interchange protein DsbE